MAKFVVVGGRPLRGTVRPVGNKNAALPILAATVLTDQEIVLTNIPNIRDVRTMLAILSDLGAQVDRRGPNEVAIRAREMNKVELNQELCADIRGSILFAGPMLARLGRVKLPPPGGDVIGRRRLDTHLLALQALGAEIEANHYFSMHAKRLMGGDILLDEASVTATENAIMAAVLAKGRTVISNAASEPHVQDLCHFLNQLGAQIQNIGSNMLVIDGVERISGGSYKLQPDNIEVGSFMALAGATGSELLIEGAMPAHQRMTRLVLGKLGLVTEVRGEDIFVPGGQELQVVRDLGDAIPKIEDAPWPGFPTDMTSVALVLATQARGTVLVFEKMFENRLFFVDKLIGMGATIVLCDPHRAVVSGPSKLHGTKLESPDIRAGMALLIASLCAEGRSVIHNIGQIDRGYEKLEQRLQQLGAHIERVDE
ncbi:MAG: UDP-N-acetylglucosamine 1-carboxyvinyltransferase [Deinococcus sp.]|nr:UDP-N-acetylglucosamine 1-carboxyvinyltransferase [Deinococcus sp.]